MRGFVAAVSQCQHRDDAGMDVGDVGDEKPCGTGDVDATEASYAIETSVHDGCARPDCTTVGGGRCGTPGGLGDTKPCKSKNAQAVTTTADRQN
jgi:hypothetical protein